jgi:RNA polymerase primary sigma factor
LVSDGNLSLLRATERFDFARRCRFSTYAVWSIINNFRRRTQKGMARHARFVTCGPERFRSIADRQGGEPSEETSQERSAAVLRSLLGHLNARERTIIKSRFGFTGSRRTLVELGRELGISKERVRQLETRALLKLGHTDEARWLDREVRGT